jgi:uncharacterized protein
MQRTLLSSGQHRNGVRLSSLRPCGFPILLLGLFLVACSGTELAPITAAPTVPRQPGQVIWHDLVTDDVETAKQFYGQLFGWTFQEHDRSTLILNNGVPIAGIVPDKRRTEEPERACWVVCLATEDVDDDAFLAEKLGGRVMKGPADMANRGRYLVVMDPQGAPLVLMQSATGDPDRAEPPIGGWLWNELWTSDIDAALTFYQFLGNYAAQIVNAEEGEVGYWILMADEQWQAGVTMVPFENMPPQWVSVIRVADPVAVTDRVPALGGRVVITPDHPLSGGSVALIEDPLGGIVMVQSWHPEESADKEQ